MSWVQSLVLLSAAVLLANAPASSAELIMVRRDGCPWCQAWDREIGPIYGKTAIGTRAPLRTMDINHVNPRFSLKSPVIYTPTFLLIEENREVARIEGYAGDQFFWAQVEGLLRQLPPTTPAATR